MNRYILIILIAIFTILNAKIPRVFVAIKNKEIIKDENIEVLIGAEAKINSKIDLPNINKIAEYKVLSKKLVVSKREIKDKNITTIKKSYKYIIKPTKSFDMPSFTIKIDNKNYKTIPFRVNVKSIKKPDNKIDNNNTIKKENTKPKEEKKSPKIPTKKITKNINNQELKKEKKAPLSKQNNIIDNSDFIFKMSSSKKKVMLGESFVVTITLIEPLDLGSSNLQFTPPKFKGFEYQTKDEGNIEENSNSVIRTIKYIVTPKKSGKLTIEPAKVKIGIELTPQAQTPFEFFGANIEWKKLKTNKLTIDVKAIPKDVELIGKFKIETKTTSKFAKPNKPFEYIVTIIGIGKLNNFTLPNLNINNVTIYKDEPKYEEFEKKGILISKLSQKYTFIADDNFKIPSIKIKSLNPHNGNTYILSTKPLDIKVKKIKKITAILNNKDKNNINKIDHKKNQIIKKPKDIEKFENLLIDKEYYKRKYHNGYSLIALIGALILGIILGIALAILIPSIFRIKASSKLYKNKLYGSYEEALNILYPHITKSKAIEKMVANLYEITNGNEDVKIDEYALNKLIKKIKEGKI